ncbi:hypothetical protein P1X15_05650 [Runella sp. MFBS21]|uniref:hypothetical protein n=1 Tax=Runella sp. MFBS21 TaxID=3034018 RepID=UPI0023F9CD0A|nr:hypothetical protein [Runella sp. MFBS21]MDF7817068.1 hypothetical protein [Runella sp. MFBS21]
MYVILLTLHSVFRWLVLLALLVSIYRAWSGYSHALLFSKTDNALRHWTATIAHLQLTIGLILYSQSPIIQSFWSNSAKGIQYWELTFFSLIHSFLMIVAVVCITIGSALAKRKPTDKEKYKTMLMWFSITLFIIFIAIPWPFSPLAHRPYFRPF